MGLAELTAGVVILALFLLWATNFLGLPGNWAVILVMGLWKWTHPDIQAGWLFFLLLVAMAGLAELIEFGGQVVGARKYGGSNKGSWGALLGAFVGAILGAPVLLGLGAIFGAVAGAFVGSLVFELWGGRSWSEALIASKGAMWGRIFGLAAKAGLGMVVLSLSVPRVWPG